MSVDLWLGGKIGEPHECVCGSPFDTMGSHALSQAQDALLVIILQTTLIRVNIQAINEPKGLLKTNNKRQDGYTLILWHSDRSLT